MKPAWQIERPAFLVPVAMAVFALTFVVLGWAYYDYGKTVLRFPVLLTVAMVVLSAWLCIGMARRGDQAIEKESVQPSVMAVVWVAAAVPAVLLLGFAYGLPLYTIVYLKARKASWPLALGLATLVLLVVLGFVLLLHVRLPLWPVFME